MDLVKPTLGSPDTVVERASALYDISDEDAPGELMQRYASFKLGDVDERRRFVAELATQVAMRLGPQFVQSPSEWRIVTPATTELAQEFAAELASVSRVAPPIDVLPVGPDPHPDSDYTGCTPSERRRIVESFYDLSADLRGRRMLIIDDFLNTGTAIRALVRRMHRCGADASHMSAFVFVRGRFRRSERERELVMSVVSRLQLQDILDILAHPDHYVTSATMLKYLARRSEDDVLEITKSLPPRSLDVLQRSLRNYYRNHTVPSNFRAALCGKSQP